MEESTAMREHIFEIIRNQMKNNDPPETNKTYKRLRREGYEDFVAKQYIGQCVAVEIFEVMTNGKEFNLKRYVKNLKALPKEPFDD
jgi:hypothetical protein